MRADKRKKLEAAGWKVGSAADFLEMSPEEEALIEVKLRLSKALKAAREKRRISQQKLAEILGSSQSRVAKMEAGDSSVTMDLLVKSIFATGASTAVVAKAIAAGTTAAPKSKTRAKKVPTVRRAKKKPAAKKKKASQGMALKVAKKKAAPPGNRTTA